MERTITIGFLGCGNVGGGVWKLLNGFADDIAHRTGLRFSIKRVLVRSLAKKRDIDFPEGVLTDRVEDVLDDPEISIVLEFLGGEEPAHQWITLALERGKTVVTANKVAFALHWHELQKAAKQSGAGLYYEAAVCGAIPIIHTLEESLQANRISYIYGIVNGTTNYILTRMSKEGSEYADVLADASAWAWPNPTPPATSRGWMLPTSSAFWPAWPSMDAFRLKMCTWRASPRCRPRTSAAGRSWAIRSNFWPLPSATA